MRCAVLDVIIRILLDIPIAPPCAAQMAANALRRAGYTAEPSATECVRRFAGSGRRAVNVEDSGGGTCRGGQRAAGPRAQCGHAAYG